MIIRRYPKSENRSLRPWSAADELILGYISKENITTHSPLILNDRFGYLACMLHSAEPINIVNYKSQEKALRQNLIANNLPIDEKHILMPFESVKNEVSLVLMKVPKSLALFKLQLAEVSKIITPNGQIICGFMTRFFTKQMIEIANEFFEKVEQTQAHKKARLMILKKKKDVQNINLINEIPLDNKTGLKQYFGVFSANNIDYATQFFLEHLTIDPSTKRVLDLASGNGVIAYHIRKQLPTTEIHLVDDSYLAVASSKLNINDENTHHHFSDCLENFPPKFFDLVVCNPPFHFEYETNIEVALSLFQDVKKHLTPNGHFQLVANQHLNYKTHLVKLFDIVDVIAENDKFIIYDCTS